jgi:hypothetical protein
VPIEWTISHPERLVTIRAEGPVTRQDVEAYLDGIVVAGCMPYGKLFDARGIDPRASDEDVMLLAARVQAYGQTMEGGALAFVTTSSRARDFVRRYLNLSGANRPSRTFRTVDAASAWLEQLQDRA